MGLEDIMLIGISHTEDKYCELSVIESEVPKEVKFTESEWSSSCHGYQKA